MTDITIHCTWCWPRPRIRRKANSDWEQKTLSTGEWKRMCGRCARSRLDNPYNALLPMRKVGSGEQQQEVKTDAATAAGQENSNAPH
jgi:hypothetical protein